MIVTDTGCIIHMNVQYDRQEENYQIFKCQICGEDVDREAEDSHG